MADRLYFIGPFLPLPRGATITTAVDWHLKVKDIEFNVSPTKIIASQSACKMINLILKGTQMQI